MTYTLLIRYCSHSKPRSKFKQNEVNIVAFGALIRLFVFRLKLHSYTNEQKYKYHIQLLICFNNDQHFITF